RRRHARQDDALPVRGCSRQEMPGVPFAADRHRREHGARRGVLREGYDEVGERLGDALALALRQRVAAGDHLAPEGSLRFHALHSSGGVGYSCGSSPDKGSRSMKNLRLVAVACVAALAATAWAQQNPFSAFRGKLKDGMYEYKTEMDMSG